MRRIYCFLFGFFLLLAPLEVAGQSLYVTSEWLGEPEELSLRKRMEKSGMTAHDIFRSFLFPRHSSRLAMELSYGIYDWNTVCSHPQFLDVFGSDIMYHYYVYAFDGYYIISLEDIFVQRGGHHFTIYGMNGVPFKREHTRQDYKLALKIVDYLQPKFEELCNMLEEYAFPVLTPAD